MATTPMAFTPTDGLRNKATYPTDPATEDALRGAVQNGMDQLRDFVNNTLIPVLDGKVAKTGDTISGILNFGVDPTVQLQIANNDIKFTRASQAYIRNVSTGGSISLTTDNQSTRIVLELPADGKIKTLGNYIVSALSGGYKIQSGSISINAYNGVVVTFPTIFSSAPLVSTQIVTNVQSVASSPSSISTTGFLITGNLNSIQTYHWFAIGT